MRLLVMLLTVVCLISAKEINTPHDENYLLASYELGATSKELREFDVFGFPKIGEIKRKLSEEEREDYIRKNLLQYLSGFDSYQQLRDEPFIVKKRTLLFGKYSSMALRDSLIEECISDSEANAYYAENKKKYLKTFSEAKESIKRKLAKSSETFKGKINSILDSLRKENNIFYNHEVIRQILKAEPFTKKNLISKMSDMINSENVVMISDKIRNNHVYLSDFKKTVSTFKPYAIKNLKNESLFWSLLEGPVMNPLLAEHAKNLGFQNKEEVINKALDELYPFVGIRKLEEMFRTENFIPTEEEMITFYNDHINDKELRNKEKYLVKEIFKLFPKDEGEKGKLKVLAEMQKILDDIKENHNFAEYAKKYNRGVDKNGYLGHIYKDEYAKVGEVASKMKEGTVSDLIIQKYAVSIIELEERMESKPFAFKYVRDNIKLKMIADRKNQLHKSYEAELFEKYKVKFYRFN